MFQPIDPIEQRKQALIQHLVGQAGMTGGGRPVGTLMGRPFGSFTRSGVDPLLRMLGSNPGENFTGIGPNQQAAAAAFAAAAGIPSGVGPGFQSMGSAPGIPAPLGQGDFNGPGISPGEFYHPMNNLPSILANYGGHYGM